MNPVASVLRIALLCLALFMLSACSSGKIVKTYEGDDRAADQIAVLTAPENIRVVAIDGTKMPTYMLSGITTDYGLLPGEHVIEFEYEGVWAISRPDSEGRKSKEVVSPPREARITVAPGQAFTFRFDRPEDLNEAEALAADFKAEIVDAAGGVVANSTVKTEAAVAVQNAALPNNNATAPVSKLEALKTLWATMSAEDKKAFLSWAFQ